MALDLVVNREVTWLFDVVFVMTCVTMALRVRPSDFFTVGVLPPLLMLGIFVILGVASPSVIADAGDGTIQAVVAGLAHHAGALITGYALCLGSLAMRQHVLRKRRRPTAPRSRIPAPRPAPSRETPTTARPVAPTRAVDLPPTASHGERSALGS
nr:DUF6542 domain-containing protein [Nocardioides sp. JQ2195]